MNIATKYLIISVLLLMSAFAYAYYRRYPLPNPAAQQQRGRCLQFFAKSPSLSDAKKFLRDQGLNYSELSGTDVFIGNTSTDFQRAHKQQVNSGLIFRVHDIETPLCGKTDALFIISFDKKGRLLNAENIRADWGCLDF